MIFQWKNVTTFRNITQLAFHLTPEPMFGDYTIAVRKLSGMTVVHQFTVNRYGKQVLVLILLPLSSRTKLSRPGGRGESSWSQAGPLLSAFLCPTPVLPLPGSGSRSSSDPCPPLPSLKKYLIFLRFRCSPKTDLRAKT